MIAVAGSRFRFRRSGPGIARRLSQAPHSQARPNIVGRADREAGASQHGSLGMTRMTGVRLLISTALAAGLGFGLTQAKEASAQALSLDEVRTCLCLQDSMQKLGEEMTRRADDRERQQAEVNRMSQELTRRYGQVDTDEELQVEQYKYQYEQLQKQQALLNDYSTALVNVSNRYNRVVVTYNAQCTTRPMIKRLVDEARQNLACQAPQ